MSTRNGNPDIFVMDADGRNLRQLTEHSANDIWPEWSPDGTQIAFPSRRDDNFEIYVINADGTNLRRLTNTASHEDFPAWSPDGTQIVFSRIQGDDGTYIMNADGSNERQLLSFPILEPDWSPDGTKIAFGSDHENFRGIYLMDVEKALLGEYMEGDNLQQLSNTRGGENCPSWSPDGSRISFISWRDGDGEIYVMDADGSNLQKLTDNWSEDEFPAWQPSVVTESAVVAQLDNPLFDEFLESSYTQLQLRDRDNLFANNLADLYGVELGDQFTNLSTEYLEETQQLERELLELLRSFDRGTLSADQLISYDAFEWYLDMQVRGQAYNDYKFLVNPVWGLQNWPLDLLSEHSLESVQDAENYIARFSNLDTWASQVIERLELTEQADAIPPRYILENTVAQLDLILNPQGGNLPDAEQIEVFQRFRQAINELDSISDAQKETLINAARSAVEETFIPAYQTLRDHLVYLSTIATEDPNQWSLPGGEAYYAYLLEYYTGTDLSADEIHELGLAEVARIQQEIQDAAVDLGYPADISISEVNQILREESPVITGGPLLLKYQEILDAADQAAGGYFDLQTSAGVAIRSNPGGPPAFYVAPEPGSTGSGEVPANLDFSPLLVNYNELVLFHHEAIPGHHTQLALAQELDVPGFQRYYGTNPYLQKYDFQAYPEGWALYAESLAWEMGLYEGDPLANLGRLRLLLLRTVRMVVDTGIHAKGWTLDQATAYLEEITDMPQNRTSMTRYLVNPGYPTGYNIGALKIMQMRERAMEELGDAFDIKEFHNTILGHGILPIGILERIVDDWIAAQLT